MSDSRNRLQSMFLESTRFDNFGNLIMRMHVRGFRCHQNTLIDIQSPITAFCGLNGTGKSTLLQLAAAAYRNPDQNQKCYYIRDFLVVGTLDPSPFTTNASIEFRFWQDNRSLKQLTLSRNQTTKRWQGYSRRPIRRVFFAGIGLYLPKIEQRDFIIRNAGGLLVSESVSVIEGYRNSITGILGVNYENIMLNRVTHSKRTGEVISVNRTNLSYSEAHMGFGEGRAQYLILHLELLPENSLILIEEPETSLHPSAQYEFGKYLVDVSIRKKHQILLTTHSEFILQALPSPSRIYLKRTGNGISTIPGLTSQQAKSLMTEGNVKALIVLVEDDCAKAVLTEIIRRIDCDFLNTVGIYPIGDARTLSKTMSALRGTGLPVAVVRDADQGDNPRENLFKLPGILPPEREIFDSTNVRQYVENTYNLNMHDFQATLTNVDHHDWLERLAQRVNCEKGALMYELARSYVASIAEGDASPLINGLKESVRT